MVWHLSQVGPIEDITKNVKEVKAHVAKFSKPDLYLAVRTLLITAALYIISFAAFSIAAKHWALWTAAAFLRAGVNVRTFIIFHDCCHGNFFRSGRANMLVGRLTGSLQFTSWSAWNKSHNKQHHNNHGRDDTALLDLSSTVVWTTRDWENFGLPRKIFLRFFRDPVIFFAHIPGFVFMVSDVHNGKLPMMDRVIPSQPAYRLVKSDFIDKILPPLLPVLVAWAGYAMYGLSFLFFELTCFRLSTSMGFMLFHLQHYAHVPDLYYNIPKSQHDRDLASLLGATFQYIPEWLKWATLGIEYHHIHHFSTRVPSYRIRACHDSAPPATWRYVKYLNLKTELQSLLLVMWNPDEHRFESFPELNWLLGF